MTWHTRTIALHLATCKACELTLQDIDADRLHAEIAAHEAECRR